MAKNIQKRAASTPQEKTTNNTGLQNWYWLLPVVAAGILYMTGLGNLMTGIDDHTATVDNVVVKEFSISNLLTKFNLGMYAPLTWLFYAIAYGIGGKSALLYHLFSLIAHCICTYLTYKLIFRLSGRQAIASAVALIYAVHPLQVEAVAWIAGFSSPLYVLFFLLACHQYMDYKEAPETNRTKHYVFALGWFIAACLAKSAAVTLPLALMVIDIWQKPRETGMKRWLAYIPFFLISLGFGILTVISRQKAGVNVALLSDGIIFFERLLILGYTPIFYWIKTLFPFKLNIYYAFNKENGQLPWTYMAAAVVFIAAVAGAFLTRKKAPYIWWGLLFFLVNMSVMMPIASMGTFELIADHYNYLPIIGNAVILVFAWDALKTKYPQAAGMINVLGYAWIGMLVLLSLMQIRIWKDTVTVITNAIDNGYYQKGRMFFARGLEYGDLGKMDLALLDFSRALELDPNMKEAYKFRGSIYGQQGKVADAQKDLEKYIALDPNDVVVLHNLAMVYSQTGQPQKSIDALTKCIAVKPNVADLYVKRASQYDVIGDASRAEADRQKAQQLKSNH